MESENYKDIHSREKRYQWIINIMLVLLGFFIGVFFESERMKAQVVTNSVEIRILKESLREIKDKLDMLVDVRRKND